MYCKPDGRQIGLPLYPTPLFLEKSLQTTENKRAECEKESQRSTRGGKLLRTQELPERHGEQAVEIGAQRPHRVHAVATGSIRNVLRAGEILAPRDAYDGRNSRLRRYTRGCGRRKRPKGDTVSRILVVYYRIRYYLSSEKLKTVN